MMKAVFAKARLNNTYEVLTDSRELSRIMSMLTVGVIAGALGFLWLQGAIALGVIYLLIMVSVGNVYEIRIKPFQELWFTKIAMVSASIVGWVIWLILERLL
ncbi:hypothetical protein [Vibrio phage phiKT1028]|nr:hypothetical protein [Vibrio phage phiKT1028]